MKSSSSSENLSIGEVARRFGLATHVLRHWEDVGLLAPARDGAGRRLFGEVEVVRIAAVLANQSAGLSLEQIGVLFDTGARGRHELLEQHLAELERRQLELEVAREVTEHALACRAHDLTACPGFQDSVGRLLRDEVVEEGAHPRTWRVTAAAVRPRRSTSSPASR